MIIGNGEVSMTMHDTTSRRAMLQGTLATSAIAASGSLGLVSHAMAAGPAIGSATKNRQWLLVNYAESKVTPENFKYQEVPLGDTANLSAGEVLVRNVVYAPMPSQRISMHADTGLGDGYMPPMLLGKTVRGVSGIAKVVKSENPKYPVGSLLTASGPWEDYSKLPARALMQPPLPAGLDPVDAVGIYGYNAQTAFFGLTKLGEIKSGETVVVSGASGSVGTAAIQIAKLKGCKVIGIAGGKDHCDKLVKDYGIDAAIDYKSEKIAERVQALAPKGVNVYFDNVGGTIMQDVVDNMAKFGRVVLCGAISAYDDKNAAPGPRNMLRLVVYSITMRGFLVSDFNADRDMAIAELKKWKEAGQIKFPVDVRKGFKKLPEAFLALFNGAKEGSVLVRNEEA
jgi:NADPH-dependent curcumin reductase CurA